MQPNIHTLVKLTKRYKIYFLIDQNYSRLDDHIPSIHYHMNLTLNHRFIYIINLWPLSCTDSSIPKFEQQQGACSGPKQRAHVQ